MQRGTKPVKVRQSLEKNSFAKLKKIAKVVRKAAVALTTRPPEKATQAPGLKKAPLKKTPKKAHGFLKGRPVFRPLKNPLAETPPWKKTPRFLKGSTFLGPPKESPPGWDTPLTPAHRINNSRLGGVNDIAVDFTQRNFVVSRFRKRCWCKRSVSAREGLFSASRIAVWLCWRLRCLSFSASWLSRLRRGTDYRRSMDCASSS